MVRSFVHVGVFILVSFWAAVPVSSAPVSIENASFEGPKVDPNGFPAVPFVDAWTEIDLDIVGSTNTGVFANTPAGSDDHIANADGSQLAFLGSGQGNALEQDLAATYQVGCAYRLTVAVGISGRFPPSAEGPVDMIELVLYYRDDANSVDLVRQTVEATGRTMTHLDDFSVYLPMVQAGDTWAGKPIGVAIRAAGMAGGFWDLDNVRLTESLPVSIPIENASFELPVVDPDGFPAVPYVDAWIKIDLDTVGGTNTGVFANTPAGSADRVANADGSQLAFLGSQQGNALEQDLAATYQVGCAYRLTVAVGISGRFPPSAEEPVDTIELVLYYRDDANSVDIVRQTVEATGRTMTHLDDFSVYLPTVQAGDAWAGKPIGAAIRAAGQPGGFWDLDNVRLTESLPVSIPIENASFELPVVDPDGFPAVPYVDEWTKIDLDTVGGTNTGVFANTAEGSADRVANADGSQLAFLGSQQGNALEQDLAATYQVGCVYRLTVAVGISGRFPPFAEDPADTIELVLYYRDGADPVDIVHQAIEATGLSMTQLQDFSLYLPPVQADNAWAGKPIGVAIRAAGQPGGFWDLDHVRLAESLPVADLMSAVEE
jgi:hypothetical protein